MTTPPERLESKQKIELKEEERQRTEIYSRVMGYYRPTSFWNSGKQQEFEDRKMFTIKEEDIQSASDKSSGQGGESSGVVSEDGGKDKQCGQGCEGVCEPKG